jgi:hypothetical protein
MAMHPSSHRWLRMMLQPPPTHYHTCHRLPSVPDPVFWPLRVAVGSHSPAATPNCRSLAPPRLQAANDAIDHAHLTPSHCRIALVSLRHNHQYATAASITSPSLLCQRRRLPRLQSEQQQHRSTTTQQKRHLWSHSSDAKQQQRATTNGSLCRSIEEAYPTQNNNSSCCLVGKNGVIGQWGNGPNIRQSTKMREASTKTKHGNVNAKDRWYI